MEIVRWSIDRQWLLQTRSNSNNVNNREFQVTSTLLTRCQQRTISERDRSDWVFERWCRLGLPRVCRHKGEDKESDREKEREREREREREGACEGVRDFRVRKHERTWSWRNTLARLVVGWREEGCSVWSWNWGSDHLLPRGWSRGSSIGGGNPSNVPVGLCQSAPETASATIHNALAPTLFSPSSTPLPVFLSQILQENLHQELPL